MRVLSAIIVSFWFGIAQAQVAQTGAGLGTATPAVTYSGPGDVVSGALAWWGLRAYSAATVGTKAANICNSGDANCGDVNTLANGNFDVATAQGAPLNCGGAGGTCTIKTLYDQSGANTCGGSACNLTQATAASRPTLTFGCLGSLPCMTSAGAASLATAGTSTVAQPYTIVTAATRTANFTGFGPFLVNGNGQNGLETNNSAGRASLTINNALHSFLASDSAWHALLAIGNGTTSSGTTDTTTTALSAATTNLTTASGFRAFNDGTGDVLTGSIAEIGLWSIGFSAGQLSSMNTNIHTYWGF